MTPSPYGLPSILTMEGPVKHVAFSPDSQIPATGSRDRTVRLWHAADGYPLCTLRGHRGNVWSVAFSPDGRTLASAGEDGTVRLWRTKEREKWPLLPMT